VPIHSELKGLGFLKFVEEQKNDGKKLLFSELPFRKDRLSPKASNWFNGTYKKKFNLTPGKNFHSFRHTFVNALRQTGVNETHIAALVGHSTGKATTDVYGNAVGPKLLAKTLKKLDYEIDLSPLRNKKVNTWM